jgi:hypothetical protein
MNRWTLFLPCAAACLSLASAGEVVVGAKVMPQRYVVSEGSMSPDGKFAMIHRQLIFPQDEKVDALRLKNYLVRLEPFEVLAENFGQPYFNPGNHRSMAVEWSGDGTALLFLVGGKWGTIGATLFELREGKVARRADLLAKIHSELKPLFTKAKVRPYNDHVEFVISDQDEWKIGADGHGLEVNVTVSTAPNLAPGRAFEGKFTGSWSIPGGKWLSRKASGHAVASKR